MRYLIYIQSYFILFNTIENEFCLKNLSINVEKKVFKKSIWRGQYSCVKLHIKFTQ